MASYKIVGADQKEYGPVTEEQLRQWIKEGRANGQTLVRLDDGPWKPLSTFPEFSAAFSSTPPPTAPLLSSTPPLPLSDAASSGVPATSGMAIAGLVCSILGLFCCGPILSTLGLVFSVMALSQINQNPLKYTGKGIAVAGIVISLAGYLLFVLLMITGVVGKTFRHFHHRF